MLFLEEGDCLALFFVPAIRRAAGGVHGHRPQLVEILQTRSVHTERHFVDTRLAHGQVDAEYSRTRRPAAKLEDPAVSRAQADDGLAGVERREVRKIGDVDCGSPTLAGHEHRIFHEQLAPIGPAR